MVIDARGIGCPKPVLMAEEALGGISEGAVEILVDNEASVSNLNRFATKNGFYCEAARQNGHWHLKIVKGYICEVPAMETAATVAEKDLFLVIATDTMGKDEGLGRILMKAYLETMKVYKELPHTIFFMNAGVRLTTTDEEIVPVVHELAGLGVEIYSCGTCLKHFGLESELRVGHRGTTHTVIEGTKDFKKTVWIG
jgi:selenium metabolism protein YedF